MDSVIMSSLSTGSFVTYDAKRKCISFTLLLLMYFNAWMNVEGELYM